jgi:SAM-dependent methyltransferase
MGILDLTYEQYWGYYWRVTSRHKIPGIFEWDKDLVEMIERECEVPKGASVLDLGCGGGDQAKLFASKGCRVVGIDKVASLVAFAEDAFLHEGLRGEFHQGDMRLIGYEDEFDLCVMLSGTFGLFSEHENDDLLTRIHRALRPGGKAFLSYSSLERYSKLSHTRSWNNIDGGYALREEWFDAPTSTYRTKNVHILLDGRMIRAADEKGYGADEVIRCYGAREIELLGGRTGFTVKAHLSNNNIGNPGYVPEPHEPRGNIILAKE